MTTRSQRYERNAAARDARIMARMKAPPAAVGPAGAWRAPDESAVAVESTIDPVTLQVLRERGDLALDFGAVKAPASVLAYFATIPDGASKRGTIFNAYMHRQNARMQADYCNGGDVGDFAPEPWR